MKSSYVRFRCQLMIALLGMVITTLAQETLWVRTVDLGANEFANGIAVRGNTIVAAGSRYEAEADLMVVRLTLSGDTIWSRTLNFIADDNAIDAAIDPEQNILAAGYSMFFRERHRFTNPRVLEKLLFTQTKDQFAFGLVVKFDSAGGLKWHRVDTNRLAFGVATDSDGNCYISGAAVDTIWDVWVAKLNPSGETIWTRRFDLALFELGYRLTLDASGNIVIALYSGDFSNFDCGVLKLSSEGETLWSRRCDLNIEDAGIGIATDHESNIIVTGFTGDGSGAYDFLIAKFDSSGNPVWQRSFNYTLDDRAFGVTCDSSANIYVAGITGAGWYYDCLTLKLNPAGEELWFATYGLGSENDDQGADVACDNVGNPIIAGGLQDTLTDFYDLLLIKYRPAVGIAEQQAPNYRQRTATSTIITAAPDILISVPGPGHYDIRLCDLCGNVRQQVYRGQLTKGIHRFSLAGQPTGLNFVRVAAPDGRISCHRLIIVR